MSERNDDDEWMKERTICLWWGGNDRPYSPSPISGRKKGELPRVPFFSFFDLIFLFLGCNLFFEAPLCWTTTLTRKEDGKRVHQTAHLHTDAADGYAPWCISALRLTVCAHPALFSTGCFIPLSFSLHFNVRSGKEKWLDSRHRRAREHTHAP
jgi:hypothetical protein